MKNLPLKLKIYLVAIYVFTLGSLVVFIYNKAMPIVMPKYIEIIFFCILLALTESFTVIYRNMSISTNFAVHLAAVILFKPLAAIIIIIIGFSLRVVKHNDRYVHILNTPVYKTLFNYCVLVLPFLYASLIYMNLGGTFLTNDIWSKVPLIIIFCIVYFLLNALISSVLFAMIQNKSIFYFFISNVSIGILSSIAMAPFGLILAYVFNNNGFGGVLLILFPIVLARYTFSLYIQTKTQYVQTVDTLMHAMEARDRYTEGHSQRVAEIAAIIAKELKYTDIQIEKLHMASLLHDVGKIGIHDSILNKPDKLTEEEYKIIKSHPEIGYNILKDIKYLEPILFIVRNHHERYDGKGYPDGKTADQIGLDVFIVQLADTIDAMSTDRPYRKALTDQEVIDEINKYSGTQFHPKVVQAYLNILDKQKKAV
jgi:putative nucleotidyltransferase with HDIG domain